MVSERQSVAISISVRLSKTFDENWIWDLDKINVYLYEKLRLILVENISEIWL